MFDGDRIEFFVASRGHHQDVGGITPGSMPPNSTILAEEGASIISFKLVKKGEFQVGLRGRLTDNVEPFVEHMGKQEIASKCP